MQQLPSHNRWFPPTFSSTLASTVRVAVWLRASCTLHAQTEASPGLLAKLGRVLKEKAAGDYERFFKGTSKTRERLGVSL